MEVPTYLVLCSLIISSKQPIRIPTYLLSFFRKIYLKKSPLKPDNKHLHMLLFTFLEKPKRFKDCNYLNSLVINSAYLFLIIPGIFFRNDGSVCRYLFFFLLLLYLIFYFFLNKYDKKNNF